MSLAFEALTSTRGLGDDTAEAAGLEERVADCVRLGIELDTTLSVVMGAIELVVTADAPKTDSLQLLRTARSVTRIVARAYEQNARPPVREHADAGRDVAHALLRGDSARVLGHCNEIGVADSYAILAIHLPRPRAIPLRGPRETAESPATPLHVELRQRFGPSALSLFADNGGTVLVPETSLIDDHDLDDFIEALTTPHAPGLTAVTMHAATADLPIVAEQVHAALELVTRLGMVGRLHRFSDIAVEYQLTRPGPGRDVLATVLDPLDEYPDLLDTLRAYVENGLDRRRTARKLHLHPNSVDYRLKRVFRLTGFDITDPSGLWNLRSALVIRDHHSEPARPPARAIPC